MEKETHSKRRNTVEVCAKTTTVSQQQIEKAKRKVLRIVESLLEECISCDELINACQTLSQADYKDVIEERNILNLCGYPICDKKVQIPRKKYNIHYKAKRIYDITERKCFCSNICYKASNFLKTQLPDTPAWLREGPTVVKLLENSDNQGSAGEEVILVKPVTENDLNLQVQNDNKGDNGSALPLHEIAECDTRFQDLVITENDRHSDDKPSSRQSSSQNSCDPNFMYLEDDSCSSGDSESDVSSDTDVSREELEELGSRAESKIDIKTSIPLKAAKSRYKPTVLIESMWYKDPKQNSENRKCMTTISQLQNIFAEWLTYESVKYLCDGEVDVILDYQDNSLQNLGVCEETIKEGYAKLCQKVNKMEEDERGAQEKFQKLALKSATEEVSPSIPKGSTEPLSKVEHTLHEWSKQGSEPKNKQESRSKQKSSKKIGNKSIKSVRFSSDVEQLIQDPQSDDFPNAVPLVDSVSQNALRQQVVLSKLQTVYANLLPLIGLHYSSIGNCVKALVLTFKLSSANIVHKPAEWKAIAVVLLRMLKDKIINHCDDDSFSRLLEKSSLEGRFSVKDINSLLFTLLHLKTFQTA